MNILIMFKAIEETSGFCQPSVIHGEEVRVSLDYCNKRSCTECTFMAQNRNSGQLLIDNLTKLKLNDIPT